ncbi:MAG: hypothetical protein ISS43_00490 [Candidatus Omnitrophica bacterium]|nr:hypothetical protein [Candidatus Omnitrophota bacterium]
MKVKGILLLLVGVLGAIFVSRYDIIVGKPINDVTGPKSIIAFLICAVLIIIGVRFLSKKSKE